MKFYVLCVGYDSDYEIVVCGNKEDALEMCKSSCGVAVFDKKPIYVCNSCPMEDR